MTLLLARVPCLLLVCLVTASCTTVKRPSGGSVLARFFLESRDAAGASAKLPRSGTEIAVGLKPVISEFDLVDVQVAEVELGECLLFRLTNSAARDLYRMTGANQGSRLVLVVNGEPLGARRIDRPFDDGTILIFVEVSDGALQSLGERLRSSIRALNEENGRL